MDAVYQEQRASDAKQMGFGAVILPTPLRPNQQQPAK